MDHHHKLHVLINTPEKPSKIVALFALIFAFALPFILVKMFPHKQKTKFSHELPIALPNSNFTKSNSPYGTTNNVTNQTNNGSQITSIKTQPNATITDDSPRTIRTRHGDTLTSLFIRLGLSTKTLQQILHDTPQAKLLTRIQTNQEIQFIIKNKQLQKMTLPLNNTQYVVLYRDHSKYKIQIHSQPTTSQTRMLTGTVHGSLYSTAKRNNIPSQLIQQMTKILAENINFARDIRDGDQFFIIYNLLFIKEKQVGIGDVLAVSYRNNGHTFQAVRHTNRTGHSNYFTPEGNSLKKAFNRYPVQFSHISSTFSLSRYHPILHYARPHKGVDLAARIGTPIHATADGRIEFIGRQGAYGNMIKIKHNNTYSTIYGHLLKFQKGLSRGAFVQIGQVIGYVGQSGLADGPHCHYEFHINNQPRNPATVQLPRGNPLSGHELVAFKANTRTLLAQMHMSQPTGQLGTNNAKRNNLKPNQLQGKRKSRA